MGCFDWKKNKTKKLRITPLFLADSFPKRIPKIPINRHVWLVLKGLSRRSPGKKTTPACLASGPSRCPLGCPLAKLGQAAIHPTSQDCGLLSRSLIRGGHSPPRTPVAARAPAGGAAGSGEGGARGSWSGLVQAWWGVDGWSAERMWERFYE